jgi:hypothetical protein
MRRHRAARLLGLLLCAGADAALAQNSDADLAKKLANPIANLISVPFQSNWDCCYGPRDGGRYTLNIQPVVPVSLNHEWNLIIRTIVPLIYQQSTSPLTGDDFGFGDTVQSFFFSPSAPVNGITWGIGPVFLWPTAQRALGSRQWGAGPTGVILKQDGGWTYGILANHIWSYAGPDVMPPRTVNATFLQPFISYTFPDTTSISLNTESTYDWIAHQWTIPINATVSKVYNLGGQRVSLGIGGKYYLESPPDGPTWGARVIATLLFPK